MAGSRARPMRRRIWVDIWISSPTFIVYSALPLGLALSLAIGRLSAGADVRVFGAAEGIGAPDTLLAVAVLIATFYVNAVSWLALSAIFERRQAGAAAKGEQTAIAMPDGLIGGSETLSLHSDAPVAGTRIHLDVAHGWARRPYSIPTGSVGGTPPRWCRGWPGRHGMRVLLSGLVRRSESRLWRIYGAPLQRVRL